MMQISLNYSSTTWPSLNLVTCCTKLHLLFAMASVCVLQLGSALLVSDCSKRGLQVLELCWGLGSARRLPPELWLATAGRSKQ